MNKRVVLRQTSGTLLVSSDIHGNLEDFQALARVFEERLAAGESCVWVGLGDWVHGPVKGRSSKRWAGEELFEYPDRSREIVEHLFELFRRHPGRFHSTLGNHEHAHLGGALTCRFHPDEAVHLEEGMAPENVAQMRDLFRSWPLVIQVPACGVVLSHGAPPDEYLGTRVIDEVVYEGVCPPDSASFLDEVLWSYSFGPRGGRRFLDHLSLGTERYDLIVHGHDRELDGGAPDGEHGYLLCTGFGAKRARKAYLALELGRHYHGSADLREGIEIRRLHAGARHP